MGEDLEHVLQHIQMWSIPHHTKRVPVKTTYLILDHPLQLVKYLGVILSDKQSWTLHIEMVTKMANNTLAFLRRNISRCPRDVNVRCYESLGRPNLEYARLHHGQHTTTGSSTKASRSFCQWRLPHYKQCFKHDEHHRLKSLQHRRQLSKLVMLYRIISQLVAIYSHIFNLIL